MLSVRYEKTEGMNCMNQTIKHIFNRRSCRNFKAEQVPQSELEDILNCGLSAPSAMNTQNWHFTVINGGEKIEWLNELNKPLLSPEGKARMIERGGENFSLFYGAHTIVMVSGPEGDKFGYMNCAFATENMCVAAESMGINSCIVGLAALVFDTDKAGECCAKLDIPAGYKPHYAVCLGYSAGDMTAPERVGGKVTYID